MYEDEHKAELLKLIMNAGSRYDVWRVFSDFCAMLADTISNTEKSTPRILKECSCYGIP